MGGYLANDFRLGGRGCPGSRSATSMMQTSLVWRRHWETEHLPLPDCVSGTAFLLPSVIHHCRRQSSESCWKLICLFKGRGAGDLWTGALEMYWLTNWLTCWLQNHSIMGWHDFVPTTAICNVTLPILFLCLQVLINSDGTKTASLKSRQLLYGFSEAPVMTWIYIQKSWSDAKTTTWLLKFVYSTEEMHSRYETKAVGTGPRGR